MIQDRPSLHRCDKYWSRFSPVHPAQTIFAMPEVVLPWSLLDTDLYKFTMQQAVLHHFPDVQATYRFTHRDKDVPFTQELVEHFRASISKFGDLRLSTSERDWLKTACPFFKDDYIGHLFNYRFQPEQVQVTFLPTSEDGRLGHLDIQASGPWSETILWEVPLMACLSEIYFRTVDTDWNYNGQEDNAFNKARTMLAAGCVFSEFGTRRRRSYHTQDVVIAGLERAAKESSGTGTFNGTSNVHFAHKYNLPPIGTIAHEWYMGVGALRGYEGVNALAQTLWEQVYPDSLLLALTDTFSTEAFYKDFVQHPQQAQKWTGLRQDSGDPFVYAPRAKEVYQQLGIDPHEKTIIFSDGLNIEKVLMLKKQCDELGMKCSFGIGTSLTNDFQTASSGTKSKALNMVIKLSSVGGKSCVKISDELTKNTGDPEIVQLVKTVFNIRV